MRAHIRIACVLAPVVVLGGCGSSGLSAQAHDGLAPLVAQVRAAAEASDVSGAQQAIAALVSAVGSDEKSGEISHGRAKQILAAAFQVDGDLPLVSTTTTSTSTTSTSTSTSTTSTSTTTTTMPGPGNGPGNGPGSGPGNGPGNGPGGPKHHHHGDGGDGG